MNPPTVIKYLPLQHFQLTRPEKVRWLVNTPQSDVLTLIKSKSLRKFLSKAEEVLLANHITFEQHILTEQEYREWLPYYRRKMTELNFSPIARDTWYQERTAQGKIIEGLFLYQLINSVKTLVGSGIFIIEPEKKATFAYKASERIELSHDDNSSLGVIIDYYFLKTMIDRHFPLISAGRSGNAFGVYETYGYPIYKLRFGYEPHLAEQSDVLSWAPVNEQGAAMFYALNRDQQLGLYFFHPPEVSLQLEHRNYSTTEHPFYEIEYDHSLLKQSIEECV